MMLITPSLYKFSTHKLNFPFITLFSFARRHSLPPAPRFDKDGAQPSKYHLLACMLCLSTTPSPHYRTSTAGLPRYPCSRIKSAQRAPADTLRDAMERLGQLPHDAGLIYHLQPPF
jgi:hypothetical protein